MVNVYLKFMLLKISGVFVNSHSQTQKIELCCYCTKFHILCTFLFLRPGGPITSLHCSGTLLRDLHWLRVRCPCMSVSRLNYVCWPTGVYTAWHRRTSPIICTRLLLMATAVTSSPLTLRLWWLSLPDARRSATVRFPWQLHVLGTVFHQPSGMRHHFCRSGAACRHGLLNWRWRNTDFPSCTSFRFVFILLLSL